VILYYFHPLFQECSEASSGKIKEKVSSSLQESSDSTTEKSETKESEKVVCKEAIVSNGVGNDKETDSKEDDLDVEGTSPVNDKNDNSEVNDHDIKVSEKTIPEDSKECLKVNGTVEESTEGDDIVLSNEEEISKLSEKPEEISLIEDQIDQENKELITSSDIVETKDEPSLEVKSNGHALESSEKCENEKDVLDSIDKICSDKENTDIPEDDSLLEDKLEDKQDCIKEQVIKESSPEEKHPENKVDIGEKELTTDQVTENGEKVEDNMKIESETVDTENKKIDIDKNIKEKGNDSVYTAADDKTETEEIKENGHKVTEPIETQTEVEPMDTSEKEDSMEVTDNLKEEKSDTENDTQIVTLEENRQTDSEPINPDADSVNGVLNKPQNHEQEKNQSKSNDSAISETKDVKTKDKVKMESENDLGANVSHVEIVENSSLSKHQSNSETSSPHKVVKDGENCKKNEDILKTKEPLITKGPSNLMAKGQKLDQLLTKISNKAESSVSPLPAIKKQAKARKSCVTSSSVMPTPVTAAVAKPTQNSFITLTFNVKELEKQGVLDIPKPSKRKAFDPVKIPSPESKPKTLQRSPVHSPVRSSSKSDSPFFKKRLKGVRKKKGRRMGCYKLPGEKKYKKRDSEERQVAKNKDVAVKECVEVNSIKEDVENSHTKLKVCDKDSVRVASDVSGRVVSVISVVNKGTDSNDLECSQNMEVDIESNNKGKQSAMIGDSPGQVNALDMLTKNAKRSFAGSTKKARKTTVRQGIDPNTHRTLDSFLKAGSHTQLVSSGRKVCWHRARVE